MAAIAGAANAQGLEGLDYVLHVIGFTNPADRANVLNSGIMEFEDFRYLTERDIRDMAEEFGKCTAASGTKLVFGLARTKKLVGVMHWVQDRHRVSEIPDHNGFDIVALNEALGMAQVRKADLEMVSTNSKAAEPGKFKDERKWPEWEKAFTNYLAVIPGVSGIPL